jgi:hypothetical protein
MAVTHHQGAALRISLATGGTNVLLHLGLQSLGEHPPCSLTGDLVEVEQELFAGLLDLMYALHRCILPADATNVGIPIRLLEGKVHHVPQEIPDPQLSIISLVHIYLDTSLSNAYTYGTDVQSRG